MKKFLIWLLLSAVVLSVCGCGAEAAPPETAEIQTETMATEAVVMESQTPVPETESPVLTESLFLKVSSITFSLVGEREDIYMGIIPRELVTWESDDPSVVSVENGVLTAEGVGTTTIRASYADRQIECTAGCLAANQEELDSLSFAVLSAPKRLPPQVDMEAPCTYFDNAAIVGDSIIYMMMQVENRGNYLGNMLFLARGGTSMNGFVLRYKNMYYQGAEVFLEDAIAQSQVERAYFMVGSNDIGSDPQRENYLANWEIMLERIREKCPDVEIVIISNIPQYAEEKNAQAPLFVQYNTHIQEYNEKLKAFAEENGCMYWDLHYYIQDHCNRMPEVYNLDGYHPNDTGYMNWMNIMRFYAQVELEGGNLS